MDLDRFRAFCLSLPHSTEQVQWVKDLVFKVGGKMYAVAALEPGPHFCSFKCSDEDFARLVERPGIVPAPYLARAHWVAMESGGELSRTELERQLRLAYDLVRGGLPKKTQAALAASAPPRAKTKSAPRAGRPAARRSRKAG